MQLFLFRRLIVGMFMCFVLLSAGMAQAKWEVGVKGGTNFYLGDRNAMLFDGLNPVYGGFVRINSNTRWATKIQFVVGNIKTEFDQQYIDFSFRQEFNFFEYGLLNSSSWTRYFSPYIFGGFGMGSYNEGNYSIFSTNIPFGLGVKYKILPKVNIALEWSMHKLFSDGFDGVSNPYHNNESNWTNKDWISMAMLMVSFDFGNKNSYCR
jgi:hypothetical protein